MSTYSLNHCLIDQVMESDLGKLLRCFCFGQTSLRNLNWEICVNKSALHKFPCDPCFEKSAWICCFLQSLFSGICAKQKLWDKCCPQICYEKCILQSWTFRDICSNKSAWNNLLCELYFVMSAFDLVLEKSALKQHACKSSWASLRWITCSAGIVFSELFSFAL